MKPLGVKAPCIIGTRAFKKTSKKQKSKSFAKDGVGFRSGVISREKTVTLSRVRRGERDRNATRRGAGGDVTLGKPD